MKLEMYLVLAAALTVVADALAAERIPSFRFDFPYRRAGRRAPDAPACARRAVCPEPPLRSRTAAEFASALARPAVSAGSWK